MNRQSCVASAATDGYTTAFAAPTTCDAWCALLGAYGRTDDGEASRFLHDPRHWDVLAEGSVAGPWAPQAMAVIARFAEQGMRLLDDRLLMDFDEYADDADTVALLIARYGADCRRLLFFDHLSALPSDDIATLHRQIVDHVRGNLRRMLTVQHADGDVAYALQHELRRWASSGRS